MFFFGFCTSFEQSQSYYLQLHAVIGRKWTTKQKLVTVFVLGVKLTLLSLFQSS